MPRFIDIGDGTPIAAAADARDALGATDVGAAVFTAVDDAAARSAIGAAPLYPDTAAVIQHDPSGSPDGAIVADDELNVGTVFANSGSSPYEYVSGRFAHDPGSTIGVNNAGYLQVDTGSGRVREMRAQCSWTYNEVGAVAFVIPSGDWTYPSVLSAAGIHLTAYGNGIWNLAVWNPASGTGHVDHSVQPGTATSFTLTVQTTTPASTQTTGSIAAGASAATVTAAIEALSNVAAGQVTVTKSTSGNYGIAWASALGAVTLTATPTGGTMGFAAPLPLDPTNTIDDVVAYGSGLTQYADYTTAGRYAAVWDEELRWLEMYIYPDTDEVFMIFPDGTNSGMIKHPGIGLWGGSKAVFELFENNSGKIDTPATMGAIAAHNELVATAPKVLTQVASYKTVTLYDGGNTTGTDITSSGSIPPGTSFLEVVLIGGGGGGGSGACQPSGTAACGGGSGGTGGIIQQTVAGPALGTTWNVTVGRQGSGGASVSSTSAGNAGTYGNASKFFTGAVALLAYGGSGGGGGGSGATIGTAGGSGAPYASSGTTSGANGAAGNNGASVSATMGIAGSGAGGGVTTAPAANNGGSGGSNIVRGYTGGTAGVVGGAAPGKGVDSTATPVTSTAAGTPGPGAGGGAGSITGAAQDGADAAGWGGGGGGGGASLNGSASGAGGDGRGGYAIVRAHLL